MRRIMASSLWALVSIFFLSGCNLLGPTEELLTPPRMTGEQIALYDALVDGVGRTDAQLKYPLRGANRSSFILFNQMTAEGEEDTALVFYSTGGAGVLPGDDALMMSVMTRLPDGGWIVVDSFAAPDKDMRNVDFVEFMPMLDKEFNNIVVGWSAQREDRKKLVVYQFRQGKLTDLFDYEYSEYTEADVNSDGLRELFLLTNNCDAVMVCKQAEFIQLAAITSIEPVNSYRQVRYGMLTESLGAVFVDGYIGSSEGSLLDTRVILVNSERLDSEALTEMQPEEWGIYSSFIRPPDGAVCEDLDKNGVMDIPIVTLMPGYTGSEHTGAIYLTEYVSVAAAGGFQTKLAAVINTKSGYMFELPVHWRGLALEPNVTVHSDSIFDEWSFYVYQGSLESSTQDAPLLRIRVVSDRSASGELTEQGYHLIGERGMFRYYALIPDTPAGSTVSSLRMELSEIEALSLFRLL